MKTTGRRSASAARAVAILHAGFVLTGIVTTLLGPILPILSARWHLSDSRAGYLFTSQFAGSIIGVSLSSALLPRTGFKRTLALAYILMALGVGVLMSGSWLAGMGSVFSYGLGLGTSIPATNLFISDLNPTRRSAALNILNLAWGAGAVASPALTALALRIGNPQLLFSGLAAAALIMAVACASVSAIEAPSAGEPPVVTGSSPWRSRYIPVLALMFFLYVGTENAVGGWAATYAKRLSLHPGGSWVLAPSFFWAALLLGRAIAPTVLRRVADLKWMVAGLMVAACGIATILAARTLPIIFLGFSIAGFGLAAVFPITIAALSHCFGTAAERVAGAMFALGGLGGAGLPWLVGFASERSGSLRLGFAVPLAGALLMAAIELSRFRLPGGVSQP